ncbi:MAG: lipopolysaccharide kinase InaA family protein [Acidobacteriota bacterium]
MALSRIRNGRFRGWVAPSLNLPACLLEDPSSAGLMPGSETLLDCRGRKIYRVSLELSGRPVPCFIYLFQNDSVSRSLRRSYAGHILRMSELLREAGFDTLEVVAAFRPKWQFLNWASFLVARELQSVQELPSTGRHVYQLHTWVDFDNSVAAAVATNLANLHDSRFVHGDLKTRHILARRNGSGCPPQILFVDLEKTKRIPASLTRLHDFFAARDLIQLLSSLPRELHGRTIVPNRDHFLKQYFLARRLPPQRQRLIRQLLRLYEPGGGLHQGETILRSLTTALLAFFPRRSQQSRLPTSAPAEAKPPRAGAWTVGPGVLGRKPDSKAEE